MNYRVLPTTGVTGIVALGLTGHQMLAVGVFVVVVGIISFKILRFKIKDKG
jgi:hypothetical protein